MVAAIMAVLLALAAVWWMRRRRLESAVARLFDEAIDRAETPAEQVAAMSQLLRRAARRRDPGADRLDADAWLDFLDDGLAGQPFRTGAGKLLGDGGFRAEVAQAEVAALRPLARQRYLSWMQRK